MKRIVRGVFVFLFICLLPLTAQAVDTLVPVGTLVGLEVRSGMVTVAAFDDFLGQTAREAGLKVGDQITAINGIPIREAEQVSHALDSGSDTAELQILRGSKAIHLQLKPREQDGQRFLGVYLRQGISGIGTVTWYDPLALWATASAPPKTACCPWSAAASTLPRPYPPKGAKPENRGY